MCVYLHDIANSTNKIIIHTFTFRFTDLLKSLLLPGIVNWVVEEVQKKKKSLFQLIQIKYTFSPVVPIILECGITLIVINRNAMPCCNMLLNDTLVAVAPVWEFRRSNLSDQNSLPAILNKKHVLSLFGSSLTFYVNSKYCNCTILTVMLICFCKHTVSCRQSNIFLGY